MSWFIREVTQPLGRARPLCTGRTQQAPHLRYSLSLPSEQQGPSVSPIAQGWPGWVGTVFLEQGSSDLSLLEQGRQATGQSGSRSLSAQSWTWLSFQLSNIWEIRPPTGELSEAKCPAEPKAGNPWQQRQKPQAPQRHWVWGPLGFSPAGRLLTNPPAHPGHNSKEGLSCRPCPHLPPRKSSCGDPGTSGRPYATGTEVFLLLGRLGPGPCSTAGQLGGLRLAPWPL